MSELPWDTYLWLSRRVEAEREIAQDYLRELVDNLRVELGLPERDWWFEDMGFARIRANLIRMERLKELHGIK